jgi:hypothetical protein
LIVLLVSADEPNVNNSVGKIQSHDHSVFVAANVEDNAIVSQDAGTPKLTFHIGRPCPIGLRNLPKPGAKRLFRVGASGPAPELPQRFSRDDPHSFFIIALSHRGSNRNAGEISM